MKYTRIGITAQNQTAQWYGLPVGGRWFESQGQFKKETGSRDKHGPGRGSTKIKKIIELY